MEEILPSYLISVNVCSISKVKASDIVIYFARSFLLRLPRKILQLSSFFRRTRLKIRTILHPGSNVELHMCRI